MVSNSILHAHIGLIVSLKPCLNLCSFRLINLSLKRVRTFAPSGLKLEFLEILSNLAFLISTLRLFYSFMKYGRNIF